MWLKGIALVGAGLFAGYIAFSPKTPEPMKPLALVSAPFETPIPKAAPKPEPPRKVEPKKEAAKALTAAAIAALLVTESRNAYYATGRPCACPDDVMRNGRRCGAHSAYSKPGGADPLCYVSDVSPTLIEKHRARLSQR